MLKPKSPLKPKILWALEQPGITVTKLATEIGAKHLSTVSEWKRTGRVAKRHLPVLAGLTGTTMEWWVTEEAPVPPTGVWLSHHHVASPPPPPYSVQASSAKPGRAVTDLFPMLEAANPSVLSTIRALLLRARGEPDAGEEIARAISALIGGGAPTPKKRGRRPRAAA